MFLGDTSMANSISKHTKLLLVVMLPCHPYPIKPLARRCILLQTSEYITVLLYNEKLSSIEILLTPGLRSIISD
jgi:hypothetical protein